MCTKFSLKADLKDILQRFRIDRAENLESSPHSDFYPLRNAAVIVRHAGKRVLTSCRWGLVPAWSKTPEGGESRVNARAETLAEKPSFKHLLGTRRCAVAADGFYEWSGEKGGKTCYKVTLRNGGLFALAGLWDEWKSGPDLKLRTFTLITLPSENHALLGPIHARMPVLLRQEHEDLWLSGESSDPGGILRKVLTPYPAAEMAAQALASQSADPENQTLLSL